jgi:hypothetical protein
MRPGRSTSPNVGIVVFLLRCHDGDLVFFVNGAAEASIWQKARLRYHSELIG